MAPPWMLHWVSFDSDWEARALPFSLIFIVLVYSGFLGLPHAPQKLSCCRGFRGLKSSWRMWLWTVIRWAAVDGLCELRKVAEFLRKLSRRPDSLDMIVKNNHGPFLSSNCYPIDNDSEKLTMATVVGSEFSHCSDFTVFRACHLSLPFTWPPQTNPTNLTATIIIYFTSHHSFLHPCSSHHFCLINSFLHTTGWDLSHLKLFSSILLTTCCDNESYYDYGSSCFSRCRSPCGPRRLCKGRYFRFAMFWTYGCLNWPLEIKGHGKLHDIYAAVKHAAKSKGWDGVDLVIIGGDFQVRNHLFPLLARLLRLHWSDVIILTHWSGR